MSVEVIEKVSRENRNLRVVGKEKSNFLNSA